MCTVAAGNAEQLRGASRKAAQAVCGPFKVHMWHTECLLYGVLRSGCGEHVVRFVQQGLPTHKHDGPGSSNGQWDDDDSSSSSDSADSGRHGGAGNRGHNNGRPPPPHLRGNPPPQKIGRSHTFNGNSALFGHTHSLTDTQMAQLQKDRAARLREILVCFDDVHTYIWQCRFRSCKATFLLAHVVRLPARGPSFKVERACVPVLACDDVRLSANLSSVLTTNQGKLFNKSVTPFSRQEVLCYMVWVKYFKGQVSWLVAVAAVAAADSHDVLVPRAQ